MADKGLIEVFYNAGEALVFSDLNNMQRYRSALLLDLVLGHFAQDPAYDTFLDAIGTSGIGSIGLAGAVYKGSGDRDVKFKSGPIIAQPSGFTVFTGTEPKTLCYYLDEADISDLTRPAATTNPRWDILSVSLSEGDGGSESRDFKDATTGALSTTTPNKLRRVSATFTWTQGSEAASPTEPATPSGEQKICAVKITPATAIDPLTDLRDYRFPIGYKDHMQDLLYWIGAAPTTASDFGLFKVTAGTTWAVTLLGSTPNTLSLVNTDADIAAYAKCPIVSPLHRIQHVAMLAKHSSGSIGASSIVLKRYDGTAPWSAFTFSETTNRIWHTLAAGASDVPIWANGYSAGYGASLASNYREQSLMMEYASQGNTVGTANIFIDAAKWGIWGI